MPSKTLIGVSVVGHIVLFTGMFLFNAWDIDRLEYRHRNRVEIGMPAPPPPEASGAAAPKVEMTRKKPKPPKELVQQDKDRVVKEEPPPTKGGTGDTEAKGGGGDGPPGACTGDNCGPVAQDAPIVEEKPPVVEPPKCPGDPRCPPAIVAPTVMGALRQSGNTDIRPPHAAHQQMYREDVRRVVATVKVCLSTSGSVAAATLVRSTKYSDYDGEILREVRRWQYRPYTVNGRPVPVCSMVTFQYSMK